MWSLAGWRSSHEIASLSTCARDCCPNKLEITWSLVGFHCHKINGVKHTDYKIRMLQKKAWTKKKKNTRSN